MTNILANWLRTTVTVPKMAQRCIFVFAVSYDSLGHGVQFRLNLLPFWILTNNFLTTTYKFVPVFSRIVTDDLETKPHNPRIDFVSLFCKRVMNCGGTGQQEWMIYLCSA